MKAVIFLMLFLCVPSFSSVPMSESAKIETDIENGKLAQRTQKALDTVLGVASGELRRHGHYAEADNLDMEYWNTYRDAFMSYFMGEDRDIGDHKPISQWLADKYDMLELLLGVGVCKQTHLSDIKTFNFTIPIVFRPCTFPMDSVLGVRIDEYRNHFSEGDVYYGLVPVVTYWVVYGVTTAATMGGGFVFIAGIAGSLAERLIAIVTPNLSDKVFTRACGAQN